MLQQRRTTDRPQMKKTVAAQAAARSGGLGKGGLGQVSMDEVQEAQDLLRKESRELAEVGVLICCCCRGWLVGWWMGCDGVFGHSVVRFDWNGTADLSPFP